MQQGGLFEAAAGWHQVGCTMLWLCTGAGRPPTLQRMTQPVPRCSPPHLAFATLLTWAVGGRAVAGESLVTAASPRQ